MLEGWKSFDPSPSWAKDEIELFVATKIAVYIGEEKKPRIEDQTIVITSHRILNKEGRISIDLADLISHDSKNGFLTSSAKILLYVGIKNEPLVEDDTVKARNDWACPACEESNDGKMERCSVCGTINPNLHAASSQSKSQSEIANTILTKLSFRGSGHGKFLEQLRSALQKEAWKESERRAKAELANRSFAPKVAGVSGLMKKAEEDRAKQTASQSEAFGDLDALMKQASEMGRLAETIAAKLSSKTDSDKLDEAEDKEFKALMADLGFTNQAALTSKASSRYHTELAKQLSAFILKFFDIRKIQIVTLADVYCYYNRSRGTDLVSPQDLARSASQFESLELPIRLRSLSSGLLVIQSSAFSDDQVAKRIINRLSSESFITPSDFAVQESISVQLATELLIAAEQIGKLCRDQTSSGTHYYQNLILQP